VILGLSLVAFAALIVAGADRLGGDDGGNGGTLQAGALDQPPPGAATATATIPIGVVPTPAPESTATIEPTTTPDGAVGGSSVGRPLVCLDVGHGGVDEGNVRLNADGTEIIVMEKDLTLAQALDLRDRLEAQGVDVVLTRETDTEVNPEYADVNGDGKVANDVNDDGELDQRLGEFANELDELQARVNVCNEAGADLLVSIHVNSGENVFLAGYEAWYAEDDALPFVDESAAFAELVVQQLGRQFAAAGYETTNRGAAPDSLLILPDDEAGTFDHLVMLSPDVPARNFVGAQMPAVIVECLFLSNDEDYGFLTADAEAAQDAIVTAYEQAILEYFADELAGAELEGAEGDSEAEERAEDEEAARVSFGGPGGTPAPPASPTPSGEDAGPTPTPRPEPLPDDGETAQVHYYGDSGRPEIALTFDLGSDRGHTEQILDFLAEHGIRASFGVTGLWAEENPDLLRRIVDDGHMLFNHTYSHASFTGASTGQPPLTAEERVAEIARTEAIVLDLTGYDMRPYFRLPYGDGADDAQVMRDIYAAGYYLVIMWTCDSYGWKQWTPAEIIQHCAGSAQPGGIILMHVGSDGTDQDALPGLVEQLAADGYAFVTVEEILQP
jgi:peptidoglycan/xylan/chitin deacetylase (PgdA/CDA1 family)/N-acetylmuramoyl-L-alanine amidase